MRRLRNLAEMAPENCALVSSGMSVIGRFEVVMEECLLAPRRPARADDADDVFVTLGPDDEDQSATDWADRDEPVLKVGVSFVEDLETVDAGREELASLLEGYAVPFLVREVLDMVSRDLHCDSVSQWLSESTRSALELYRAAET